MTDKAPVHKGQAASRPANFSLDAELITAHLRAILEKIKRRKRDLSA
jgi:hypothetical protein